MQRKEQNRIKNELKSNQKEDIYSIITKECELGNGFNFPWSTNEDGTSDLSSRTYMKILLLLLGFCNEANNDIFNLYTDALPPMDKVSYIVSIHS